MEARIEKLLKKINYPEDMISSFDNATLNKIVVVEDKDIWNIYIKNNTNFKYDELKMFLDRLGVYTNNKYKYNIFVEVDSEDLNLYEDYYINKMVNSTKDVITLEKIYNFLDNKEELFKLLFNKDNEYRLMANIEVLKDNYNNQLLKYFKDRFYEVVAVEKSRNNYRKAATYIGAINKLNDGEKIINELISELKNSEYAKRTALFDEIDKAIDNK